MLSCQAAQKQMAAKKFAPVYLFFGEEKYLQEELLALLTAAYLGEQADFGRHKLDGRSLDFARIIEKLDEQGLFSAKQLLIVDDPPYLAPPRKSDPGTAVAESEEAKGREEPFTEILAAYLDRQGQKEPPGILVFLAPRVDRRKRLFKLIDKEGVAVECSPLKGEALAAWIRARVEALGKKIDRAAMEKLLFSGEHDLHYLSTELEKFAIYLAGEENTITVHTVENLFSGDIQGDVFKLADALAGGRASVAEELLELLLRRREKPLLIFFMLVRHYRLLLQAHCLLEEGLPPKDFAAILEVHPFAARKLREQAVLCSRPLLEEVLIALQDMDKKIKTGRIDPAQALRLILGRIDNLQQDFRSVSRSDHSGIERSGARESRPGSR